MSHPVPRAPMRLAGVAVVVLLSGCLAFAADPELCDFPSVSLLAPSGSDMGPVPHAPGEAAPALYWLTSALDTNATYAVRAWTDNDSETVTPAPEGLAATEHAMGPREMRFGALAVDAADGAEDVRVAATLVDAPGLACAPSGREEGYGLAPMAEEPPRGAVGKGVLVRTAGFWLNGTSFYTNHAGVHERADIPKGYLGEYTDDTPLKVYVYDQAGTEMPRRYQEAGYAVTIRGFNEALKGIPQGGARVAQLAPEDAYTIEGREEHPLYGEALVFWIEAVEVVDLPCIAPQPVCDAPSLPPVPPVPPLAPLR